jgi:hypothetical protein
VEGRVVSGESVFIVDASSWICLHEQYYSPEIFPALWTRLRTAALEGRIKAPTKAIAEIGEEDGIGAWVRMIKPSIVPPVTSAITQAVATVSRDFPDLLKDYSGRDADPWLVAYAMRLGYVVVTEESLSTGKPRIPNACEKYSVECIKATEMLRRLGIKWEDASERSSGSFRVPRR